MSKEFLDFITKYNEEIDNNGFREQYEDFNIISQMNVLIENISDEKIINDWGKLIKNYSDRLNDEVSLESVQKGKSK